jgi:quercetin dioxygenase-like cupin family protein
MSGHVVLALALALAAPLKPDPAGTVRAVPRFQGTTQVRVGERTESVRVDIRLWTIAGGQRIAALELPFRGLTIVELRGGRLTTVIEGQRVARSLGEIWSVPAGTPVQVETGDDMATFQTTVIGE